MKFEAAIRAIGSTSWDWSAEGFALVAATLGLALEPDADEAMPVYESPWGKEWVQASVEDGHVDRVEFLVEQTAPRFRPFSTRKLEALARKYRSKHTAYVARATKLLGAPAFVGEPETRDFPEDEDAHVLALWKQDTARVMVIARNEGPDTPFWISIVVKPLAPSRAQTARQSRPIMRAPTRQSATAMQGSRFDTALDTVASMRWDWSSLSDAIVEKLALPAKRDGERIEMAVETVAPPSDGFSEDDMEYLFTDYVEKFQAYVERAQRILGKPKYNDGMGLKGCPKDETAELLALWPLKTARVMLLFTNQGETSPYSISIVVKPR